MASEEPTGAQIFHQPSRIALQTKQIIVHAYDTAIRYTYSVVVPNWMSIICGPDVTSAILLCIYVMYIFNQFLCVCMQD